LAEFFVDTNVLIYAYAARDSDKLVRAQSVLDALVVSGRGAISAQVLGEFYSTLVRKEIVQPAEAELAVQEYAKAWPVCDIWLSCVLEAARAAGQYRLSYYDALIWATAKLNGIPNILSEDGQDGQIIEGVRRVNPLGASFDLAQLA
jgi:predicted nucleic acid-binding protein